MSYIDEIICLILIYFTLTFLFLGSIIWF